MKNDNNEVVLKFFNLAFEYLKKGVEAMNEGGFEGTRKANNNVIEQKTTKPVVAVKETTTTKKESNIATTTNNKPSTVTKKSKPIIDLEAIYNKKYLTKSGKRVNQIFWDDFIPQDIKEQELTYCQILNIIKRDNILMYRWYIERCSKRRRRSSYTLAQLNGEIIATIVRKGIVVFDKYKTTMWKGGKGRDRGTYFGKDYLLKTENNNK